MKKYIIGVCGYFDTINTIPNGQTLKTLNISKQLKKELGDLNVKIFDYSFWKKNPIKTLYLYIKLIRESQAILILPARNAIQVILPLVCIFGLIFNTKTFYCIIGAWLPIFLKNKPLLRYFTKKMSCVFAETKTLQKQLNDLGVFNVEVMPNFKIIPSQDYAKIDSDNDTLRLFFLARVMPEKGVEEMIDIIKRINNSTINCSLDIYGPILPSYKERFSMLKSEFPSYIQYKGCLDNDMINATIINYDLQIFPTKFKTEGIPGSILDSFYAGVPVLASEWNSASDLITDHKNGLLFRFGDYDDMFVKLEYIIKDRKLLKSLKRECRLKGREYLPHEAIDVLLKKLYKKWS